MKTTPINFTEEELKDLQNILAEYDLLAREKLHDMRAKEQQLKKQGLWDRVGTYFKLNSMVEHVKAATNLKSKLEVGALRF